MLDVPQTTADLKARTGLSASLFASTIALEALAVSTSVHL